METGGTKIVCAIASGPHDIRAQVRFATGSPDDNIPQIVSFFRDHQSLGRLAGVGIAASGPLDLDRSSPTFGYVTTSTMPGWENTDLAGRIGRELDLPAAIDTDVNGAAWGEYVWGAGQGLENLVYVTVGTGIGIGVVVNGKPLHGLLHPEGGHMRIAHDWQADPYSGYCSFHGDCWEGLACGPAIRQRWGQPPESLPADHPAWELEAGYIAQGLHNLTLCLSPNRFILGGGVMSQPQLYPLVRSAFQASLASYLQVPAITHDIDRYIVPPGLGNRAGVLGAVALASQIV